MTGEEVEDAVEEFCCNSFFADFVIRSPKYQKVNGAQKEAADILIIFESTLVVIQVKSKFVNIENGEFSEFSELKEIKIGYF